MGSQGRFMLMVVPAYIGLGDVLSRLPLWASMLLVVAAAMLLFTHTALFAAGYSII
jgi:hypothetical protein